MRNVLNLRADKLLQLVKPIYGPTDSGDFWDETFQHYQGRRFGMTSDMRYQPSFFMCVSNHLIGLFGSYFDDILCGGTPEFSKNTVVKPVTNALL